MEEDLTDRSRAGREGEGGAQVATEADGKGWINRFRTVCRLFATGG